MTRCGAADRRRLSSKLGAWPALDLATGAAAGTRCARCGDRADAAAQHPSALAAETRWTVAAAPSTALEADAPGAPGFTLDLIRWRGGPARPRPLANGMGIAMSKSSRGRLSGALLPVAPGQTAVLLRAAYSDRLCQQRRALRLASVDPHATALELAPACRSPNTRALRSATRRSAARSTSPMPAPARPAGAGLRALHAARRARRPRQADPRHRGRGASVRRRSRACRRCRRAHGQAGNDPAQHLPGPPMRRFARSRATRRSPPRQAAAVRRLPVAALGLEAEATTALVRARGSRRSTSFQMIRWPQSPRVSGPGSERTTPAARRARPDPLDPRIRPPPIVVGAVSPTAG